MASFKSEDFKPQALTLPSVPRDKQECRTFKSVTFGPCDDLFLVLATRARGTSFTRTYGKIDEHFGMEHCSIIAQE